jgi:hypothetical protein
MKTKIALVGIAIAFNVNAERIVIDTVEPVIARQQTLAGCLVAALDTVAGSLGAAIPQEQLARDAPKFLRFDNASYQEITTYLNSGWHSDAALHRFWMTSAISFVGSSLPDATLLTSFRDRRPVLLAYSSGDGSDHVLVAIGAEFSGPSQSESLLSIGSVIVLDPLDGRKTERDWKMLKRLLIGSWLPINFASGDCGAIGATFLHPECGVELGTLFSIPPPKSARQSAGPAACADFRGIWEVPQNDMWAMILSQTSQCFLFGDYRSRGVETFNYAISGRSYSHGAVVRIDRTSPSGCKTKMFGSLAFKANDVLLVAISSTDGQCDFPLKFEEERIWLRR